MKPSAKIQKMDLTVIVAVTALSLMIVLPAKAITWGWPDGILHPDVGAMVVQWPDSGDLSQICSGTLIAVEDLEGRVFLTAGHCTDYLDYLLDSGQIDIDDIYVNFDEYALNEPTLLAVAAVFTHPKYLRLPPSIEQLRCGFANPGRSRGGHNSRHSAGGGIP